MKLSLQVFCDASKSSYARQDIRLPIILPSNYPVVKALIIYKHVQLAHAGVQMLMYILRESYLILKGRKTIKEVIKTCIICKRFNAKPISVSEGLLPQDRVRDAAVFEIIGLDLAGPLILKNGEKNWILILTCVVYRAIHLELLTSVSTDSFLLGLNRFIARRGRPSVIYSDNGTNFKGAYLLYQKMNLEKLKNVEELNPISWKFIPPQVPWWGGFWERLFGPVKRPLTYVTDDVEDLEPLTPAMFLQDIREIGVPELDQIDENKLNKIVYRNRIQIDLRKRFRVEYLGQLRETRNIKGENTLSEGDIVCVLVGDDHTKRLNWNLGKILKLYPGKDKKVGVAQVKTKFGSFLRPVRKLYLLEVMEKNKSSVHPTNFPLFSDANEGSHLPINIDPVLSKPQRAATSPMQPCSSISNGGARLEARAETSRHQQEETSSMQPCSSVSDGKAGVELRLETLELPDILTSDGELQQPGPRRSRYGRLLKPRKGLNDSC
ncbi:integrase catalytic domain-containing protein [Trichonephila clavipes]|uniref:Integrase catalytic domain-containing protein n=1 Tax=Trichonephila clavipes TaxID=2585209 RepID=A0A8X6RJC4_TRICX|nr:integrase catalytic domain-containing protein [Trichonephila clavipes]